MRETDAMYTPEESAGGGFAMGLFWGALAGVAVGMLLAPKTGAELRGQLASTAGQFRRRAGQKIDDMSGTVNDMVDKGRRTYGQAMDAVDDIVQRGRKAVERGQETFENARNAAAEGYDQAH